MGTRKPYYDFGPIKTLAKLAQALDIEESELVQCANSANNFYRLVNRRPKPDGTFRDIYDAKAPLKKIQGRIKQRLLDNVSYPGYLQGGIKDIKNRRSIYADAALHVQAKIIAKLDVTNFFPSVIRNHIYDVWHKLFRFSPVVAECLTKLTTKNDGLAQGARTSTHLANLVLWRDEHGLVEKLSKQGFRYSRYVDDITISARTRISTKMLALAIASARNMLASYGLVVKRQKQSIVSGGKQMLVHNLIVNQKVNLTQSKKDKIRNEVYRCEKMAMKNKTSPQYTKFYRGVASKVGQLKRFDPKGARKLRERLLAIKPVSTSTT
jgi:hypothetical protein